jgi:hypothetical protein
MKTSRLEPVRLLDGYIGWLCSPQDLIDEVRGAPEQIREVRSVGHQPRRLDPLPKSVHGR